MRQLVYDVLMTPVALHLTLRALCNTSQVTFVAYSYVCEEVTSLLMKLPLASVPHL